MIPAPSGGGLAARARADAGAAIYCARRCAPHDAREAGRRERKAADAPGPSALRFCRQSGGRRARQGPLKDPGRGESGRPEARRQAGRAPSRSNAAAPFQNLRPPRLCCCPDTAARTCAGGRRPRQSCRIAGAGAAPSGLPVRAPDQRGPRVCSPYDARRLCGCAAAQPRVPPGAAAGRGARRRQPAAHALGGSRIPEPPSAPLPSKRPAGPFPPEAGRAFRRAARAARPPFSPAADCRGLAGTL